MSNKRKLDKSHNHNHFWIEDYTVYESYNTTRGVRYRPVAEVIMEEKDFLTEEDIKSVNEILEANYEPQKQ
ncbi:hypothetical protein [Tenacibaculum sp. nBUS_03]|uniref:hypothetical protein n=1 Tax=Tenacibaculum sp. nBUS_03 TaxID=3395320 RepID=UPI003EBF5EDE